MYGCDGVCVHMFVCDMVNALVFVHICAEARFIVKFVVNANLMHRSKLTCSVCVGITKI